MTDATTTRDGDQPGATYAGSIASTPFLLPEQPMTSLDDYLAGDGGLGLARAQELGPAGTID
ncbi:MAG: hypothetical protein JO367_19700, partial [Actinobacteria bacterium]|nr:hypothetical protein [Actinomycetota bacterium]